MLPGMDTSLIPEIGKVPQALRSFRIAWVEALVRGEHREPYVPASFAARHARLLHFVDVRARAELSGPLGRVPGSFSVLPEDIASVAKELHADDPVVVVDRSGERGPELAKALEAKGMRLVASMIGGVAAWRGQGYATTRALPLRLGKLARIEPGFEAHKRTLSLEDIREHLGDPRAIHKQKLASLLTHGHLSCVDGRDHGALLGTPGGDGGELLLVLSALEQLRGTELDDEALYAVLRARLDAFGSCGLHTDIAAGNRTIAALRAHPRLAKHVENVSETLDWRAFFTSPPPEAVDDLLEIMAAPDHLGCGHLKLSMLHADEYGTRAALVRSLLRAFFRTRWEGSTETVYQALPGGHAEGAVLRVRTPEDASMFAEVPLVSPLFGGTQMFVAHPEVARTMRGLTMQLLGSLGLVPTDAIRRLEGIVDELASRQLSRTLHALGEGLPIYDLVFDTCGGYHVEAAGIVP
jgi:rhodanese-related sulfurtransferase